MDDKRTVEKRIADRCLVEGLRYTGGLSPEGRRYALGLLYPKNLWVKGGALLLAITGFALILSSIIYLLASSWHAIPPILKFSSIQIGIVSSIGFALYFSLSTLKGKVLLLFASILPGASKMIKLFQTNYDISYTLNRLEDEGFCDASRTKKIIASSRCFGAKISFTDILHLAGTLFVFVWLIFSANIVMGRATTLSYLAATVIFITSAMGMKRLMTETLFLKTTWFASAMMLAGKVTFAVFCASWLSDKALIKRITENVALLDQGIATFILVCCIAFILASAATYRVYPHDRYLSSTAALAALIPLIFILSCSIVPQLTMAESFQLFGANIGFLFVLQMIAVIISFAKYSFIINYRSLFYANITATWLTLSVMITPSLIDERFNSEFALIISGVAAACALAYVIAVLNGKSKNNNRILLLYCIIIALGAITHPAVLLALLCITLGYAMHNKIILWLGILNLPIALFLYYYGLHMTLLQKSTTLVISGTIMLALGAYLYKRD